jgi:hypothetical protein
VITSGLVRFDCWQHFAYPPVKAQRSSRIAGRARPPAFANPRWQPRVEGPESTIAREASSGRLEITELGDAPRSQKKRKHSTCP